MSPADEIHTVAPGVAVWTKYDPAVKADLSSAAISTVAGMFFIDPIPVEPGILDNLIGESIIAGVVVTNANHARASRQFSERFAAPIFGHDNGLANADFPDIIGLADGQGLADALTVISIAGAAPGEIALHHNVREGTVVVGDALINFEPHGFGFLPKKYCSDQKLMRRSLRKLLDYSFTRMLFAHGTPILADARSRLEELLNSGL